MDSRYQAIFDQPRPRQVRLSPRGKSWLTLLGSVLGAIEALLVVFLLLRWTHVRSLTELIRINGAAFYSALLLPFLPALYRPALAHQKELLEQGEIAVASVKARYKKNGRGPYYVRYTFRDPEGNVLEDDSIDTTELLREGSGMLVFYDGDNLDDKIAQCAAYYEVIAPGFASDYIDQAG